MTTPAWVFLVVTVGLALLGWLASWRRWRPVVVASRPAALATTAGVALWLLEVDRGVQGFLVAGVLVGGVGELLLALPRHYFASGAACFMVARVLYGVAFLAFGVDFGSVVLVLIVAAFTLLTVGRILLGQIRRLRPGLVAGTALYMAVSATMVSLGVATGDPTAGFAVVAVAVADVLLGWNRFVRPLVGGHGSIHVVAHGAQLALVLSLLTLTPTA